MSDETLRLAGILLVLVPTVAFGGETILRMAHLRNDPYLRNPVRRRLWIAGHAHAGVLLLLSLVALLYVDAAGLSDGARALARTTIPASAIFVPAAFFLSVLARDAERPNRIIYLAYAGFASLTIGLLTLGIGLLRASSG
jgi:hypothetical protein